MIGCSTTTGSNSSGTGADSGPWPSKPTRNIQQNVTESDKVISVPLHIIMKCQMNEKESLVLNVSSIELKSDKQSFIIATNKDVQSFNPAGIKFSDKVQTQIISTSSVKKFKYLSLKLKLNSENSFFYNDKLKYSINNIETTLPLGNWIPYEPSGEIRTNLLQISIKKDNIILNNEKMTAEIKPEVLSIASVIPAGGITGKVSTFQPSTKVIAIFNGTTLEMGSVIPNSSDGSFTITGLPAGIYKLKVITGTSAIINDKLIEVKDKTVDVKEIKVQLTAI
jgi:hypothetical protein